MLKNVGAKYVILGHSENRQEGENDKLINLKVKSAIKVGLKVIFCIGETLKEKTRKNTQSILAKQIKVGLDKVKNKSNIFIAYEPVWAIGTGETASPDQAQEMHRFIRETIRHHYGSNVAEDVSILYGGSVKPENAKEIFSKPDVDGGLIGGAALKASDFTAIVCSI
mgnify:CR=1 FL=1